MIASARLADRSNLGLHLEERQLRALVLDDEDVDRMRLIQLCKKAGLDFHFSEAGNLTELRRQLDSGRFDIVFLDYHLGLEDGLTALQLVTSHPEQDEAIPMMVTSNAASHVIIHSMRSGCTDYLVKEDLSVETLRAAITASLERRILLAAFSHERLRRKVAATTVARFVDQSTPEMQRIVCGMIRRLRTLRETAASDHMQAAQFDALQAACNEVLEHLGVLSGRAVPLPGTEAERPSV